MIRNAISHSTLAIALVAGVVAVGVSAPAVAQRGKQQQQSGPKVEFSKEFRAVAADLDKALSEGSKNPAVTAAAQQARNAGKNAQAKAAAVAQVDAALGGVKARLDAATAAASTAGDRLKLGEMNRTYGVLTDDPALQYSGLTMMIDSGLLPATALGQIQWLAGIAAYQTGDYANAAKYVRQAKDGGYQNPQLDAVLADSYKRSNNPAAALQLAQQEIAAAKAAGTKPSETAIRNALQAAYDAKQAAPTTELATLLVQSHPSATSWNTALSVVRVRSAYQAQETLDLMRLMKRTNAFRSQDDYVLYASTALERGYPGETLDVINSGVAAGKLTASDAFVTQAKTQASGRVSADRASLPNLERDARKPGATGVSIAGAADAFLSYGDAAKAAELYHLALGKPGIDTARVLTRLGIAQADKGDYAAAQATFAKIEGPRKPLAQLWASYAAQKAAGG
jgi:hypothetical protein